MPPDEAINNATDMDWGLRAGGITCPDAVTNVLKSKGVDPTESKGQVTQFKREVRAGACHQRRCQA